MQQASDCYSFMTGISSYNSQLTPAYLLHTEKRGQAALPYVFIMAFPTSPIFNCLYIVKMTPNNNIKTKINLNKQFT